MATISNEQAIEHAMNIIIASSECKLYIQKAMDDMANKDLAAADEDLKKANEEIIKGHHYQTVILQQDAGNDENFRVTILFAHAQDTLMCTQSELFLAQNMLKILKSYTGETDEHT